jgi:hypothetical protein
MGIISAIVGPLVACEPASIDVKYRVEVTEAVGVRDTSSSGSRLGANWRVDSYGLAAIFGNPAREDARILWNQALYTRGSVSEAMVVAFGDPRRTDAEVPFSSFSPREYFQTRAGRTQPPTVIPAGAKIEVQLLPRSKAAWREFTDGSGGFWYNTETLFETPLRPDMADDERRRIAGRAVGEEFEVTIPVQVEGNVFLHHYRFRVTGAEPQAARY